MLNQRHGFSDGLSCDSPRVVSFSSAGSFCASGVLFPAIPLLPGHWPHPRTIEYPFPVFNVAGTRCPMYRNAVDRLWRVRRLMLGWANACRGPYEFSIAAGGCATRLVCRLV
jgi:hypothetical protein